MINETNVKCFLSLANTLNFTKTANEIYMTQQAVSKNISKLEESLGFLLFKRSRHSVELTQFGKQFYSLFARFSAEFEATLKEIRMNQGSFRTLKLGYQNWLDFGDVPNQALAFIRKTNLNLFLTVERHSPVILTEHLLSRQMDLVIMYERFAPHIPQLNIRTILHSPAIMMISSEHPLATPDATYQTFLHEPFIFDFFEYEKTGEVNERAKRYTSSWGLDPREIIIMPNRDSAYTAAEMGLGIIITTEMSRIAQSNVLRKYPLGVSEAIVAIWQKEPPDPIVEEYVELLAQKYQDSDCTGEA